MIKEAIIKIVRDFQAVISREARQQILEEQGKLPDAVVACVGVVIQEADLRALKSGTTTDRIFDMVERLRQKTDMPLVFMGYLNPVFHYGYERFFKRCEQCGISGIIIPDLPYEEKGECADIAASYGVDVISMIAPTSESRIRAIAGSAIVKIIAQYGGDAGPHIYEYVRKMKDAIRE